MSFVEDLKKTKLTGLVDLIHERREKFDQYVTELRGTKRCKLKKRLGKIVGTEHVPGNF